MFYDRGQFLGTSTGDLGRGNGQWLQRWWRNLTEKKTYKYARVRSFSWHVNIKDEPKKLFEPFPVWSSFYAIFACLLSRRDSGGFLESWNLRISGVEPRVCQRLAQRSQNPAARAKNPRIVCRCYGIWSSWRRMQENEKKSGEKTEKEKSKIEVLPFYQTATYFGEQLSFIPHISGIIL